MTVIFLFFCRDLCTASYGRTDPDHCNLACGGRLAGTVPARYGPTDSIRNRGLAEGVNVNVDGGDNCPWTTSVPSSSFYLSYGTATAVR